MSDAQDLKDLRAATVRGLRWTVIARPLVECMLLGSMVVLARLIPPAEFGHYATALVISGFGAASVSAITTALVQQQKLDREHLQAANALALACGAALVGLTFIAAQFVVARNRARAVSVSAPVPAKLAETGARRAAAAVRFPAPASAVSASRRAAGVAMSAPAPIRHARPIVTASATVELTPRNV